DQCERIEAPVPFPRVIQQVRRAAVLEKAFLRWSNPRDDFEPADSAGGPGDRDVPGAGLLEVGLPSGSGELPGKIVFRAEEQKGPDAETRFLFHRQFVGVARRPKFPALLPVLAMILSGF